jgi:hypothetical protein
MIWRGLFVLGFGLPVEFFIGVKALSSKKAKVGVAIEARPGLEAKASIEARSPQAMVRVSRLRLLATTALVFRLASS